MKSSMSLPKIVFIVKTLEECKQMLLLGDNASEYGYVRASILQNIDKATKILQSTEPTEASNEENKTRNTRL
jgi:hypothetical protein